MTAFSAPYSLGHFQSRVYTVTVSVLMHARHLCFEYNSFKCFLCMQSNAFTMLGLLKSNFLFTLVDALHICFAFRQK